MSLLIIVAAILSGVANAGLLAVVNAVLHRSDRIGGWMIAAFVGLALGRLATSYFSQMISVQFS